MLKKCLFVLALLGLMAVTVHADGPADPNHPGFIKIDGSNADDFGLSKWPIPTTQYWPGSWCYTPLCICEIPVVLKAGMWIRLVDCDKKKVVLEQKDCVSIGYGAGDFPCYSNCITLTFQSNFPFKLGYALSAPGPILTAGNMNVTFTPDTLPAGQNDTQLCVKAKKANLMTAAYGQEVAVAKICVTVVPNL